jgi:Protein of unknown function (DUF1552)
VRRVPWLDRDRARLSRRTFLRAAGTAIALPYLEAMWPASARAQAAASARRFLAWYVPNGINMADWTPAATGSSFTLTPILAPLANVRSDVLVLTGLANRSASDSVPGDHARGTGSFMTARKCKRTDGADIQNGISLDQRIAQAIGSATSLPSLQLGAESGGSTGNCDSGYSCAYARNVSWAGPQSPLAKETNPSSAFDRLFQGPDAALSADERARRRAERLSILDSVTGDAGRLRLELGTTDRHKLDEYLDGVRALELRVENLNSAACTVSEPAEPTDFPERVRTMSDLMVLAFRCDSTRVISFMLANAGSNQTYPDLGVFDGHHQISHHQGDPTNLANLTKIDTWEVGEFAYLIAQLAGVSEPGGSLLDSSVVFFSSEIEDGDAHRHTNLPILLAGGGGGGGAFVPGRHIRYSGGPTVANLFLAILRAFGIQDAAFGDDGTAPLSLA